MMSARMFGPRDWEAARQRRALAGRAPRLVLRRLIMLRQQPGGSWRVVVHTWRYGRWLPPELLCASAPKAHAQHVARDAWKRMGLPVMWQGIGDAKPRPLRFGRNASQAVLA